MAEPLFQTASGSWDWRALADFPDLLVRRSSPAQRDTNGSSADDGWVIAARSVAGETYSRPEGPGAWAGHVAFHCEEVVDHVPGARPNPLPGSRWWQPEVLLLADRTGIRWPVDRHGVGGALARSLVAGGDGPAPLPSLRWVPCTPKERYLACVEKLLRHLQRGDIYEVNYCTERVAEWPGLDPFAVFDRLLRHTEAPFAALYRHGDRYAICMSPEHFLRVEGRRVTTRPMKGTRRRSTDPDQDAAWARALASDAKERSENIMAVDVARHDLSRIAASGSVRVEELCAVKSYPNVHQLVSTVSAELREGADAWDAVRAAFPMASMTGAPKRSALRLIDDVEEMPRGLFSGSLGYRMPDGTLDLNVVIRTINYDASTGRASLITGSAITAVSDPEKEWEECELKARSVLQALGHAG